MFKRISHKTGQTYVFTPLTDTTRVSIEGTEKMIIIYQPVDRISQSYYNWQNGGMLIQEAFPYLTNDEREFLLTGIVPQEWDEIFPPDSA